MTRRSDDDSSCELRYLRERYSHGINAIYLFHLFLDFHARTVCFCFIIKHVSCRKRRWHITVLYSFVIEDVRNYLVNYYVLIQCDKSREIELVNIKDHLEMVESMCITNKNVSKKENKSSGKIRQGEKSR